MEWNWEELLDTDFLQGNHSHSTAESASSTTSSTTTNQTSYAAHTETNTNNSHVHKTIPPTTPYETLPASILPINSLPNEVTATSSCSRIIEPTIKHYIKKQDATCVFSTHSRSKEFTERLCTTSKRCTVSRGY
jgi:hypothetical protein